VQVGTPNHHNPDIITVDGWKSQRFDELQVMKIKINISYIVVNSEGKRLIEGSMK